MQMEWGENHWDVCLRFYKWRVACPIAHYTEFNKNERWARMSDTRLKYKERWKRENKGIIQGKQGDRVSWSKTEWSSRTLLPRRSWSCISKNKISPALFDSFQAKKSVPGCHDNRDGTPQLKSLMMSGCCSPRVHMCHCLAWQLVRMKIII